MSLHNFDYVMNMIANPLRSYRRFRFEIEIWFRKLDSIQYISNFNLNIWVKQLVDGRSATQQKWHVNRYQNEFSRALYRGFQFLSISDESIIPCWSIVFYVSAAASFHRNNEIPIYTCRRNRDVDTSVCPGVGNRSDYSRQSKNVRCRCERYSTTAKRANVADTQQSQRIYRLLDRTITISMFKTNFTSNDLPKSAVREEPK